MTTWLQKQKKGELQALAKHAGIENSDTLLKDELVTTLDSFLRSNSTRFSNDKLFSEFYERGGSPAKKPRASASAELPEGEKPEKKRRKTIAKDASSPEGSSSALVPRTPASLQRLASRVRLPASPAVDRAVQAQTTRLSNMYNSAVKRSGLKKTLPLVRQELSSVETINLLILIFEALGLSRQTLPLVPVASIAPSARSGPINLYVPDLRNLRTSTFWAPTTLWLLTSFLVPAAAAYVFNLTYTNPRPKTRRTTPLREFDPLTFNITKALLVWAVYPIIPTVGVKGLAETFGYSPNTVQAVNDGIMGGWFSMLIGASVGVITGMHDTHSFKS